MTREDRAKYNAIRHSFSLKTNLPAGKALASVANKVELIDLICNYVCYKLTENCEKNKVFVTSCDDVPTIVCNGLSVKIVEMKTSHEEL